jgi:hypothetical protein
MAVRDGATAFSSVFNFDFQIARAARLAAARVCMMALSGYAE